MYKINQEMARKADSIGAYLTEPGQYVGQFTRAENITSKVKGTKGIGFTFESGGQSTKFDVWTAKATGEPLQGMNLINAIMTCMSLKELPVSLGTVERYDYETKTTNKVQAEVFPALLGKDVGLVFQRVEYEKMRDGHLTGETGWRLELVAPFRAADSFTSSEIWDRKKEPAKLLAILAGLRDRPLKQKTHPAPQSHGHDMQPQSAGSGFDDMGDDLPY
jgi:hypothetical protein